MSWGYQVMSENEKNLPFASFFYQKPRLQKSWSPNSKLIYINKENEFGAQKIQQNLKSGRTLKKNENWVLEMQSLGWVLAYVYCGSFGGGSDGKNKWRGYLSRLS